MAAEKNYTREHHEPKTAAGTAGLYHIIAVIAMGKYRKKTAGSIMNRKRLSALPTTFPIYEFLVSWLVTMHKSELLCNRFLYHAAKTESFAHQECQE